MTINPIAFMSPGAWQWGPDIQILKHLKKDFGNIFSERGSFV